MHYYLREYEYRMYSIQIETCIASKLTQWACHIKLSAATEPKKNPKITQILTMWITFCKWYGKNTIFQAIISVYNVLVLLMLAMMMMMVLAMATVTVVGAIVIFRIISINACGCDVSDIMYSNRNVCCEAANKIAKQYK